MEAMKKSSQQQEQVSSQESLETVECRMYQINDYEQTMQRLEEFITKLTKESVDDSKSIMDPQEIKVRWQFKQIPTGDEIAEIIDSIYKKSHNADWIACNKWNKDQKVLFQWVIIKYCQIKDIKPDQLSATDWVNVSQLIPGRTPHQCQKKWNKSKYFTLTSQPWTTKEDNSIIEIHRQFCLLGKGSKWAEMAPHIAKLASTEIIRDAKQLRERWINKLDPSILRRKWDVEENLSLLYLVLKHGKKWALISKIMGNSRTEFQVKHRFMKLIEGVQIKNFRLISNMKISFQQQEIISPLREQNQDQDVIIQKILELEKLEIPENKKQKIKMVSFENLVNKDELELMLIHINKKILIQESGGIASQLSFHNVKKNLSQDQPQPPQFQFKLQSQQYLPSYIYQPQHVYNPSHQYVYRAF